jgi:hypothetical protein
MVLLLVLTRMLITSAERLLAGQAMHMLQQQCLCMLLQLAVQQQQLASNMCVV